MKTVFAVLLALALSACSGAGSVIRPLDSSKPPTVYIEPMEGDGFGLHQKIESALALRGFDPVSDPARASMRLRARYTFAPTDTVATVRLSDAATGDGIYYGEGKNGGFGTLLHPGAAIMGCFERALADLPRP